ncbi:thiamine transport system ATP-binding protein [Cereibacter ovatus]|uniref:Thiamine transport system ATP-binding protein n=1 Tax=Cereibacter ovatus TaxID=439529 RepID=A0A285CRQ4_9RHOB|nr:ATP-binding cassette domain-containing protein [Cereibacter ovatus]SNX69736.1 thiamine transport system ATP-binding protein [Cereibacter ovatus]
MLHLDRLLIRQDDFQLFADWTVDEGERIAVIGPSGGGKSTLLMTLAGFIAPTQGRVLWRGEDLAPLGPGRRPMSILFQDQNLFPHLTLRQNLGLGLSPRLRLARNDEAKIATALDRVGLAGLAEARPGRLSGGQQGRAALARVLLQARPILLLDEPFAALGPALKAEMLALVASIATECRATVLLVTHDPGDAKAFAARTVLVADGEALAPRPTADLFADPPAALRAYLGG